MRVRAGKSAVEAHCDVLSGDPHDKHQAERVKRKRERLGIVDAPLDLAGWRGEGWHTFFQVQRRAFAALEAPAKEDGGRLSNIA